LSLGRADGALLWARSRAAVELAGSGGEPSSTQTAFVSGGPGGKNALLSVEFRQALQERGAAGGKSTLEASRASLRPIIMTSVSAFIPGVVHAGGGEGAGG